MSWRGTTSLEYTYRFHEKHTYCFTICHLSVQSASHLSSGIAPPSLPQRPPPSAHLHALFMITPPFCLLGGNRTACLGVGIPGIMLPSGISAAGGGCGCCDAVHTLIYQVF